MATLDRRTFFNVLKGALLFLITPIGTVRTALAQWFPTRTVEKDTFSFDPKTGLVRWEVKAKTEPYRLVIDGLVEAPVTLSYEQLRKLPSVTQVSDFHCVEGWTVPQVHWSGFRFQELLKRVKPLEGADYVVFHAIGETGAKPQGQSHYVESFSVRSLLDERQEILMTLDKDGKPLSHDRGAPLRVITPYKLAYKSIKFVNRVEFVREKKPGWWTLANPIYGWEAPVDPSRLNRKRGF